MFFLNCFLDIAFAEGPDWRQRRRFALQNLRNFGVGKIAIESTIMEEIRKSKEKLKSTPEIQINNYFFVSFLNIIWSVVGGRSILRLKFDLVVVVVIEV